MGAAATQALTMAIEREGGPGMQHSLEEAAALAVRGPVGSILVQVMAAAAAAAKAAHVMNRPRERQQRKSEPSVIT